MREINEVASHLVALCRQARFVEAVDRYYAPDVVSVESVDFGLGREQRGREAVRAKNVWWEANNDLHAVDVAGPYLGAGELANQFAVRYQFDATSRITGERRVITERARDTGKAGKIEREEFFYPAA